MFNFFKKSEKQPKSQKEILEFLERLDKDIKAINQDLQDFKKQSRASLQKVGIKRFNPFKEVGGDQSFSIALLDADNNGLVLTGYYSREMNRVYTKPIENGQSKYPLSDEEIEAIKKANI